MNELMQSNVTTKINEFKNVSLRKATDEIISIQKNVNASLISVAGIAGEVAKNETYKDDGFKTPQEWLMKTFNYKKSTAYTMVKIGKEYTDVVVEGKNAVYVTIFKNPITDEDFTLTQLEKLLPLGKDLIMDCLNTGDLDYHMTVEEIRKFVSECKENLIGEKKNDNTSEIPESTENKSSESTENESSELTENESSESTENENPKEGHVVMTIDIWTDCILVDGIKFKFSDINDIIKNIRKTVKEIKK